MSLTTEPQSRVSAEEPLAVLLRVRTGDEVQTHRLSAGECRVGAGADADVVVADKAVSRTHLLVRLVPEGIYVADLGSRNGSFYQEQRFSGITLALGAKVRIGETEIEFSADRAEFEGTRGEKVSSYAGLFGKSPAMQQLFVLLRRLEGSLVNVLIEGESGTGKELVARALHEHSRVRGGPLVVLNCGALDRSLVRSELFGYRKGAFTGAHGESQGAVGDADGGTLFLDEIGELPLDIQPILLRVLESGTYCRVGETKERPVKLRILSATNRDLEEEVEAGRFRKDLYFRLMVVQLRLPPLRERRDEIPGLARFLAETEGFPEPPKEILEALARRDFPGNVRELKHALAAYGAIGQLPKARSSAGGDLESALSEILDLTKPYAELKELVTERMTRLYLEKLLAQCAGNLSEASRVSGLQRGYLRSLTERYGLR